MAEHRSRCSNRINGLTCWRDAGEDGLCNVCRAAKRRGEQARERNRAARASAASIHDGHDARAYALLAAALALGWWHDITPTDTGDDTP